jgi:hypothetical protein
MAEQIVDLDPMFLVGAHQLAPRQLVAATSLEV